MHKNYCLFALLLFPFYLSADIEDDVYGSETINEVTKESPFSLKITGDYIANATIDRVRLSSSAKKALSIADPEEKREFKKEICDTSLDFTIGGPQLTAVFAYNPSYCEGAYALIGYTYIHLGWDENPLFNETNYQLVNPGFGLFTKRWKPWFWLFQASANIDAERTDLWLYTTYDITLWGRRACGENFNYHVGILVQTGMKMDRFYPILGFDWTWNECWKLNAIFPINFSIVYQWNPRLAFSIASRFFNVRSRAGPGGKLSRGTWRYENTGIEAMVAYELPRYGLQANIHAGYTTGARIRIAERDNTHPNHFDTNGAAYGGAELTIKF